MLSDLAEVSSHRARSHFTSCLHIVCQVFVADGIGQEAPWEEIRDQVLRRSKRFVEQPALGLRDKRLLKEIPRRQCFATQLTLSQLFGAKTRTDRVRRIMPFAQPIVTMAIVCQRLAML